MGPVPAEQAPTLVDFPLQLIDKPTHEGTLEFTANSEALVALMGLERIQMAGVPLPSGETIILDLLRNGGHSIPPLGLYIDGEPVVHDPLDQTMWAGTVVGSPHSQVFVSFATYGSYGWIYRDGEYTHLSSFAGPDNQWNQAQSRLYTDAALQAVGGPPRSLCSHQLSPSQPSVLPQDLEEQYAVTQSQLGIGTLECKVAVETDYQYWEVWGDSIACVNYTNQLLFAASLKYFQELDVSLTYPYIQLYTSFNDPWSIGLTTAQALNIFRTQWNDQPKNGADLAHFLSGFDLNGGRAQLGFCAAGRAFGVSTGIDGGVNFPVTQSSSNWDFFVLTHEIGHNFSSLHTHDYCPPIDTCDDNCTGSTSCTDGFLMSYCHACGIFSGVGDIIPSFGSATAQIMRNHALQCLPPYVPCSPDALEPNDTIAFGTPVFPGFYDDLNFCTTDSTDIYFMQVPPGQTVIADIHFTHSTWGNIQGTIYDQGGGVLSVGLTDSDNETLVWTNPTGATQDVRIWLNIDTQNTTDRNNHYSMDIDLCAPDSMEPNNTGATAPTLQPGTYADLNFCSTDNTDVYKTVVPPGFEYSAVVLFPHSTFRDINAQLYDPQGVALSLSQSTTDNEQVAWINTGATPVEVSLLLNMVAVGPPPHYNTNQYDLTILLDDTNISEFCNPNQANNEGFFTSLTANLASGQGSGCFLQATDGPIGQFGYILVSDGFTTPGFFPTGAAGRLCLSGQLGRYNIAGTLRNSLGQFNGSRNFSNLSGTGIGGLGFAIPSALPFASDPVIASGETWHFQLWHRQSNQLANFSNGVSVTF